MLENPRILIKTETPLEISFVGASKLRNSHILQDVTDEEDVVRCLPDLQSTTGVVEVELAGDSEPRAVTAVKYSGPS